MSQKPSFLSIIKISSFRSLWINQILVQLAYNTLNFALIIWVFKLEGSNLAISALMLAIYLPVVLFGIFAGVVIDILDRRKIILIIDSCLVVGFLAFMLTKRYYPLILVNAFLINSLAQFFMPAEGSSIPMLVSRKYLFLANSLFSLTLYGSVMVGFSLAGPVLNVWGINAVFWLGAILLGIAFLLAHNLPVIKVKGGTVGFDKSLTWRNFQKILNLTAVEAKETADFIKGKLNITAAIGLLSAVQGVIGVLAVLLPSYMERVLHIHATDSSYFVMIPLGLGMISGALLVGRLFHGWPRRAVVLPGLFGASLIFILVGMAPAMAKLAQLTDLPSHLIYPRYFFRAPVISSLFALGAFLLGFFTVSIIIPCQTVLQENTTEQNRGKIFAVLGVLMTAFSAIPILLAGGLSDVFGVIPIFLAMGIIIFIMGLIAYQPSLFFEEDDLPFKVKEFLGLSHWG